ncbi:hypothetical protein C8Q80DRAFT_194786 [Daedaleopsis nitida]|nr:hypothetical protein C8Q80DRAFT_194786 [Daedaleopsis nitida]
MRSGMLRRQAPRRSWSTSRTLALLPAVTSCAEWSRLQTLPRDLRRAKQASATADGGLRRLEAGSWRREHVRNARARTDTYGSLRTTALS